MVGIGLDPDFFDTLPDGQPMYSQLARYPDPNGAIRLRPEAAAWRHLLRTAELLADRPSPYTLFRRGILRHWCGLFLLEISDILHRDKESNRTPVCMKRADLLFRQFKKLSVENYLGHHDIGFYADALHNQVSVRKLHITPRRGDYCLLDKTTGDFRISRRSANFSRHRADSPRTTIASASDGVATTGMAAARKDPCPPPPNPE